MGSHIAFFGTFALGLGLGAGGMAGVWYLAAEIEDGMATVYDSCAPKVPDVCAVMPEATAVENFCQSAGGEAAGWTICQTIAEADIAHASAPQCLASDNACQELSLVEPVDPSVSIGSEPEMGMLVPVCAPDNVGRGDAAECASSGVRIPRVDTVVEAPIAVVNSHDN
jgi:hypothetical protein